MSQHSMEIRGAIMAIVGAVSIAVSRRFLTPSAPRPSWFPSNWKPLWRQQEYYTGPGYTLMVMGYVFLILGGGLAFGWGLW
jgi:hypothetical protein